MKINYWLMTGLLVAASATAQNSTNALPTIPPPLVGAPVSAPAPAVVEAKTNAPVKKAVVKKKKVAAKPAPKKPALTEAPATLVPGPAEVSRHQPFRGRP